MPGPYAPFASLQELLQAAKVSIHDADNFTIEELVEMALPKQSGRPLTKKTPKANKAIRSIYIPFELQQAVDLKARRAGTNFNQVVTKLLEAYVNGR